MGLCKCGNQARYTTEGGSRTCALCAIGLAAVRDLDLPEVLWQLTSLLQHLDNQRIAAGIKERERLRWLLGVPREPRG